MEHAQPTPMLNSLDVYRLTGAQVHRVTPGAERFRRDIVVS